MRSISIDPPFYVESAVNTRRVAEIVLFMNTLPKETSITSGYSWPSEGTDGGGGGGDVIQNSLLFTMFPSDLSIFLNKGAQG